MCRAAVPLDIAVPGRCPMGRQHGPMDMLFCFLLVLVLADPTVSIKASILILAFKQ